MLDLVDGVRPVPESEKPKSTFRRRAIGAFLMVLGFALLALEFQVQLPDFVGFICIPALLFIGGCVAAVNSSGRTALGISLALVGFVVLSLYVLAVFVRAAIYSR
jgi:hypothetical protein